MIVYGVCVDMELVYTSNYVDPTLINIIYGTREVGDFINESDLKYISMDKKYAIVLKQEKSTIYFVKGRRDNLEKLLDDFIVDYKLLNQEDLRKRY